MKNFILHPVTCVVVACLGILGLMAVADRDLRKNLSAPEKSYNVVLLSSDVRVVFKGTHIETSGFCSSIYKGLTLDTVICAPHLITEAEEEPVAEEPKPTRKAESR